MASIRIRRVGGAPVVAIRVWLPGGSSAEAVPGQAWVSGRMLVEGTEKRDWRRIADDAERRGVAIAADAGLEAQGLSIDALSDDLDLGLQWAAELVRVSNFPEDRRQWMVRQTAAELEQMEDHPDIKTSWAFSRQLYGSAARGRPLQGTNEGLKRLDNSRCLGFQKACLERGAIVTVAGDLDEESTRRQVVSLFGDLVDPTFDPVVESDSELETETHQLVDLGDSEQAHWFGGSVTVGRRDPDYWPLALLGVILGAGGGLNGRISHRVRELEGLAYGCSVATVSTAGRGPGSFAVGVGASPERVVEVSSAVSDELAKLLQDGVTADELEEARAYLLGRDPFLRETARQWANLMAQAELFGQPLEDAAWVGDRWREVTRARILDVARRHLSPERLLVTIGASRR